MVEKAFVNIKTFNELPYSKLTDYSTSFKSNQIFSFPKIQSAKAFFYNKVESIESLLKEGKIAFKKIETKDKKNRPTYYSVEYSFVINRQHTIEIIYTKDI